MNRETSIRTSDTLVVTDRRNRRRWVIIGAAVILALVVLALALMMGRGAGEEARPAAAAGGRGGQAPTVTVIVPGRSEVGRTVTANGSLAANRDRIPRRGAQWGNLRRPRRDKWLR